MAFRRPKLGNPSPGRQRVLTAATAVVDLTPGSSWSTWKFGHRDWQREAWRLYDVTGELWKLSNRIGDSVAKARLYVTEVGEDGEEQGEVSDERIRQLSAVPMGTGAQRDDCLRLAGVDLAVGGECWIVGEGAANFPEKAEGTWFVVTAGAIKREGGTLKVRRPKNRSDGGWLTLQDGTDILIRCWGSHPDDLDQADSFTRSAIVPLREIELLTKREFAELDSRLTGAGMMFVPESIDFPRGEDDPEGLAGFMAYVQRAAAASMRDQSTANAMVPIMVSVPDELMQYVSDLKPVTFWSDLSAEIGPMKERAIARVASFAEIPAEVLSGIGDANHWTAWLISEEGTRWISRYLGNIADALTRGFLQLALTSMGVADPERYAFAFDTSTLAARPNRLEDALKLRELFLISDEETVKAGAFDVEQMPTVAERAAQLLLKVVQTQPDLMLDPAVQAALGLPQIEQVGLPATADQNADGERGNEPGGQQGPPNDGEADDPPDDGEARSREITAALDRRIELAAARPMPPPSPEAVFNAACKLMVYRALELAGGRLTTPQERRGRWGDVPRHELHHHVGPITSEKAARVTDDAWRHVGVAAADLGVDQEDLQRLLSGYVLELLTRGIRHHDDFLYAALTVANKGQGLVTS
jgi:hypothetical protein